MFDMFEFSFMVQALLVCLVMASLLSYLGIHVVGRGIVFVDLALGQISSLGVALADFLHVGEIWLPTVLTLVAALLLSFINIRDRRLKLEAIIGIIYVIAAAVTVLIISKTAHGESDVQEVIFGVILAVSSKDLLILTVVFAVLAVVHLVLRRQMFEITNLLEEGKAPVFSLAQKGVNFVFYLSIGLAIVFAVRIGGVLPVFAFLIVPGVIGVMLSRSVSATIIIALTVAILVSYFGLFFSFQFDFPAGPSIVAVFGLFFILAVCARVFRPSVLKAALEEENPKNQDN